MPLLGRQVILQVGADGAPGREFVSYPDSFWMTFEVEGNRLGKPTRATIQAANLNPDSIALFQAPGAVVRLLAGYDTPMLIFRGSPVKNGVTVKREGPTRILQVEATDGGPERAARVDVSFATDTTTDTVFGVVAAAMGVPVARLDTGGKTINLSNGLVLHGTCASVLDRFALSMSLRWYVRDGGLVIEPGTGTGDVAVVFSAASGNLIGSPQRTDQGVEVTGLLSPTLRPGKPYRVQASELSGDYIADYVKFKGDSRKQEFYVTARGKPRMP